MADQKMSMSGKLQGDFNKSSGHSKLGNSVSTGLKTQKGKGHADDKGSSQKSSGHQPLGEKMKELVGRGAVSGKALKKFQKRHSPKGSKDTYGGEEQTKGGSEY